MHLFRKVVDMNFIVFSGAKVWIYFHSPYNIVFKQKLTRNKNFLKIMLKYIILNTQGI